MEYALTLSPGEAVANGAQLLDEKLPGWWKEITLEELELASCRNCVCGQLAVAALDKTNSRDMSGDGRYVGMLGFLNLTWHGELRSKPEKAAEMEKDWDYGFNVIPWEQTLAAVGSHREAEDLMNKTYAALEDEWRLVIEARLEADKLPVGAPPVEEPVSVPA